MCPECSNQTSCFSDAFTVSNHVAATVGQKTSGRQCASTAHYVWGREVGPDPFTTPSKRTWLTHSCVYEILTSFSSPRHNSHNSFIEWAVPSINMKCLFE